MRRPLLAGALTAAAVGGYALLVEPRLIHVRRVERRLDPWPAKLDGLRVALVSDLHAGAPQMDEDKVAQVVAKANEQKPDLIALLGDYVDPEVTLGDPVSPEAVGERLGELKAPLGVFAVLGNHDWRADGERVRRALRHAGISVLENDAASVEKDGCVLWIVGLADATERRPDTHTPFALVPEDAPLVVLTHDPDLFPRVPASAAITFAGHTHGGQVNLPLLRRRYIPSRFGERYGGGGVEEGGRLMYVSRGLGTSNFPVRLGAPPEIVMVTLRAERG